MCTLDFLAHAVSSLAQAQHEEVFSLEGGAPVSEAFCQLVDRCRERSLPIRKTVWAGGGFRRDRAVPRLWLEARWLLPASFSDLIASISVPFHTRRTAALGLRWWLKVASAFHRIARPEDPGARPRRSVRFLLGEEEPISPRFPPGWYNLSHAQRVEVSFPKEGGVHLEAGGILAPVLAFFAQRTADAKAQWVPPLGRVRVACAGSRGELAAAEVLLAAALWWRFAGIDGVVAILGWFLHSAPGLLRKKSEAHPLTDVLAKEAVESMVVEAFLQGLWPLASLLGAGADAEEEVAGWCRELEAAWRQVNPPAIGRFGEIGDGLRAGGAWRWPPPLGERRSFLPNAYYVAMTSREQPCAWPRLAGLSRGLSERLFALADGERTLAEMALRLSVEFGLEWESAVELLWRLTRDGKLVPLQRRLRPRTLLYFSYGSCMSRPSFRETIPKFELIGEAVLKGYRLGFTHRSAVRGGGVADIVPEQGGEVRGILYRISRAHLPELDEREGVSFGHYQREWVNVEALGVRFEPVLTYTVVNKAPKDIRPSDEYAGLILDGARGLLSPEYVACLEASLERLGVEPEIPF